MAVFLVKKNKRINNEDRRRCLNCGTDISKRDLKAIYCSDVCGEAVRDKAIEEVKYGHTVYAHNSIKEVYKTVRKF